MLKRLIGEAFLRVAGWKVEGGRPPVDRYVIIAAPHTSNWDLPFMLAFAFIYDIPVRWMGKHTLFEPPFGAFFTRLGGIPIIRNRPGGDGSRRVPSDRNRTESRDPALHEPRASGRGKGG